MQQQIGGPRRGTQPLILELGEPIAAAEKPDAERAAARGRQHVPDAVSTTIAVSIGAPSAAAKTDPISLAY
jgi:hypothetical protein